MKSAQSKSSNIAISLQIMQLGLELKKHKLRRENPKANESELEKILIDWYISKPRNTFGIRDKKSL